MLKTCLVVLFQFVAAAASADQACRQQVEGITDSPALRGATAIINYLVKDGLLENPGDLAKSATLSLLVVNASQAEAINTEFADQWSQLTAEEKQVLVARQKRLLDEKRGKLTLVKAHKEANKEVFKPTLLRDLGANSAFSFFELHGKSFAVLNKKIMNVDGSANVDLAQRVDRKVTVSGDRGYFLSQILDPKNVNKEEVVLHHVNSELVWSSVALKVDKLRAERGIAIDLLPADGVGLFLVQRPEYSASEVSRHFRVYKYDGTPTPIVIYENDLTKSSTVHVFRTRLKGKELLGISEAVPKYEIGNQKEHTTIRFFGMDGKPFHLWSHEQWNLKVRDVAYHRSAAGDDDLYGLANGEPFVLLGHEELQTFGRIVYQSPNQKVKMFANYQAFKIFHVDGGDYFVGKRGTSDKGWELDIFDLKERVPGGPIATVGIQKEDLAELHFEMVSIEKKPALLWLSQNRLFLQRDLTLREEPSQVTLPKTYFGMYVKGQNLILTGRTGFGEQLLDLYSLFGEDSGK